MSHYDCEDCGSHLGVAYGSCPACTPKEVIEAKKALETATMNARYIWDNEMYAARKLYIDAMTRYEREEYERLYEAEKLPKR